MKRWQHVGPEFERGGSGPDVRRLEYFPKNALTVLKLPPAIAVILFLVPALFAAANGAAVEVGTDIMPLFKQRCVRCHGPAKREAALHLASPLGIARGGDSGAVVVPGDADASLLWQRVEADEMPPDEPLTGKEKHLIRRWIAGGAAGLPATTGDEPEGDEHWAFQRIQTPAVPAVRHPSGLRTPIDYFVQASLDNKQLAIASAADPATLIRRVCFDLTGLPPTPDEIADFLRDPSPAAYAAIVDRYLASERYGERWGKYWLDAAGYADSNGYFNADTDRPLAYRYRDYVIRSIHRDKPWDQFVREQIAGDELVGYHDGAAITDDMIESLEAVHFLRNSPDGTDSSDGNPNELLNDRYTVLEGTLQIIGSSLLGITVQCARCHDHKYEPLTQRDYYQLQAVIYPAFNVERWIPPAKRFAYAASAAELAAWQLEVDRQKRLATPQDAAGGQKPQEDVPEKPGKLAIVCDLTGPPPDVHLLIRGERNQPGETVEARPPAWLTLPEAAGTPFGSRRPDSAPSTGRRLAFAQWLTQPGSPAAALLARVTVNRWWQHHFGRGLVSTADNLGYSAEPPSHPELLEYLAGLLIENGWRGKAVHRQILLSAVYQQQSHVTPAAAERDPDNRWLSRFPLRRLDAEAIRDGMLAVSGELDQNMYGPYVPTARNDQGEVVIGDDVPGGLRRSIYLQQRRTQLHTMLEIFDSPSIVTNCTFRNVTTVPLQSLALLNGDFVRRRAEALARRLDRLAGADPAARIRAATVLCFGRPPTDAELNLSLEFIVGQPVAYPAQEDAERRAWIDFCQMLMASNPFLYVM